MCNKCYRPACGGCSGCYNGCEPDCPIKLDFACIIYNKDGKNASTLDGLGLGNGATLSLVIELLDEKIKQLNVLDFYLPYLRSSYIINTMEQFSEAVDDKLQTLNSVIGGINTVNNLAVTANDSNSIDFSTSGTLDHTLTANVKISATSNNQLSIQSDGLFSAPQTLSINYTTKQLTISGGNNVDLTPLITAPTGFLGEVSTDPTIASNGNYWYNTTQNKLKIKLTSGVKEILTA
jgi:hypothetical protein